MEDSDSPEEYELEYGPHEAFGSSPYMFEPLVYVILLKVATFYFFDSAVQTLGVSSMRVSPEMVFTSQVCLARLHKCLT